MEMLLIVTTCKAEQSVLWEQMLIVIINNEEKDEFVDVDVDLDSGAERIVRTKATQVSSSFYSAAVVDDHT